MPASAQSESPAEDRSEGRIGSSTVYEGWYVVRAGDTLEQITQRYLGDAERWRENWRLNPELKDPHDLQPGQRLRILLRSVPDEGAVLTKKARRVEDQLPPLPWQDARLFDVLRPRDSVRTFESSSAELTFGDDTRLVVSEESLIFLDHETVAAPGVGHQIEILVGQADLAGRGRGSRGEVIELILGDAVARPEPSARGSVQTRARRAEASSQLMAYEGGSRLASAGVEIEVPQGMGSAVPEGAPPGPPEKLLPAPELSSPAPGARQMTPRPEFEWRGVEGAVGWVVEVCGDVECGELVVRTVLGAPAAGGPESSESSESSRSRGHSWRPAQKLPVADLHWRVTAISPSGLDGYPSESRWLIIASDTEDTAPPSVAFEVHGLHVPPRSGLNRRWILGDGARLEARASDAASGIERLDHVLDGERVDEGAWSGGWSHGPHEASFVAVDGAGHAASLDPILFVCDLEAPELTWGVEGVDRLGTIEGRTRTGQQSPGEGALPRHRARRTLSIDDPHSIWPWRDQDWQVRLDGHHVTLTPGRPLLLWVSQGEDESTDDLTVVLGPERGLWVLATDPVCGPSLELTYDLELETRRAPGWGRHAALELRLEAADAVGNARRATLRMRTGKADDEARAVLESGPVAGRRPAPEPGGAAGNQRP